jgi:hypothetical protein
MYKNMGLSGYAILFALELRNFTLVTGYRKYNSLLRLHYGCRSTGKKIIIYTLHIPVCVNRDSSVGIANGYGLGGLGIEFRLEGQIFRTHPSLLGLFPGS